MITFEQTTKTGRLFSVKDHGKFAGLLDNYCSNGDWNFKPMEGEIIGLETDDLMTAKCKVAALFL